MYRTRRLLVKARALADLRAGQPPAAFWFTDRSER